MSFRLFMIFAAGVVAVLGYAFNRQEKRRVTSGQGRILDDGDYDKDYQKDLEALKIKSFRIVNEYNDDLTYERDSIQNVKPMIISGPCRETSNNMFPFKAVCRTDGYLNYSNANFMFLYKGKKALYIHTTRMNFCDGVSDCDHVYYCEYDSINSVEFDDYEMHYRAAKGENRKKTVKSFGITSKIGEVPEVFIDVVDYELQDAMNGKCDSRLAENAFNRLCNYNVKGVK